MITTRTETLLEKETSISTVEGTEATAPDKTVDLMPKNDLPGNTL